MVGEIAGLAISIVQALQTTTPLIHTVLPTIFKPDFNDTAPMMNDMHDLRTANSLKL